MPRKSLLIIMMLAALCASAATITPKSVKDVIDKLTLEQKARLLVGAGGVESAMSHITPGAAGWTYAIEDMGIPSINLADGPVGVRINPTGDDVKIDYDENGLPIIISSDGSKLQGQRTSFCTAFPSTTALAATWDKEAAYSQGVAMGDEARCYGVDVILSPGINIIRNPLCGRNFEYYSEDPVLGGMLASEVIKGIQSRGIGTSLKHFVANNQQTGKKFNDARISKRALREIYLKGFEICVKEAHPWTVMGSYNKIAGEFTQTNQELLLKLLRDEWGFDGLVLTDWTVRRPTADLLNARTALMMPGEEEIVQEIIEAVNTGAVSEATLDACVADVLSVVAKSITAEGWEYATPDLKTHAAESRRIAGESMVLLKNNSDLLPLDISKKVALFGASAYKSIGGGTGSSNVNKLHVIDIDDALVDAGYMISPRLREIYVDYDKCMSNMLDAYPDCPDWQKISYHRTVLPEMNIAKNKSLIDAEAASNDVAVIVIGRGSGETSDRVVVDDFNLTSEEQNMIVAVSDAFKKAGKPVVVVLNVCGTIEIASWRDKADAILVAWLPGQECGYAVADVLSGKVNPSGRLPMTFPINYADMPSSKNYPYVGQTEGRNFDYTNYAEDIWVGYRYFVTSGRPVAYPFGYGLSYTDFEYTNPIIKKKGDKYTVTVVVTNTGQRAGREVVQLYIKAPGNEKYLKPAAELKTFAKTAMLEPGESQSVSLQLTDYDLASFDQDNSRWLTDAGDYEVYFGLPGASDAPATTFKVAKPKEWKVADILAPVQDFPKIQPLPSPLANLKYYDASDFEVLGRVYPDSLPVFSRVPSFLKGEVREDLYKLGQQTAGMSIRFKSNANKIALDWKSRHKNDMTHMASLASRGVDLYVLTPENEWRYIGCGRPMDDPTTWLVIDDMKPEMREYMMFLPLYDGLEYLRIGVPEEAEVLKPSANLPKREKPLVIYGSSIAHGATASRPGMAASNQLQRRLGREVINLGFSANAHIDYEIARMMADVDAMAYVLDFVPNATVDEINSKALEFVRILRDKHPLTPLIFVEDPYFANLYLDESSAKSICAKNEAIRAIYERLRSDGVKNIYYIPQHRLMPADGDGTSDGIHFTDVGFNTYCDAMMAVLDEIMNQDKPQDEMRLTAMTFNIHAGSDASIETLAKAINNALPDFVAIEEIDAYTKRGNAKQHNDRNIIADLAAATGMFPLYGRTMNFAGGYYGIGILSKHPCVGSEVVELPNPNGHEPRALLEGTFLINGRSKVIFASTHLCVEDSLTRTEQAKCIASRYENATCPIILGGDFNSLPDSAPIKRLQSVFENISGTEPTFPSHSPEKKLDYLFVKAMTPIEIMSISVPVDNRSASDHLPVVSTIILNKMESQTSR